MSGKTEWRAEPMPGHYKTWRVVRSDNEAHIGPLDKPTAHRIAAVNELIAALGKVHTACLFTDDDGRVAVTSDPHISEDLFVEITQALNKAWEGESILSKQETNSVCERCKGTGVIDAPYSGSDPCCPDCDGTGLDQ